MENHTKGTGLRYNEGKVRYDLLPAFAQEQYAKVITEGAVKYADRNWENGMPWSKVIASLKRHIAAIERGEDFDNETGLYHAAHVMCNAAFLTEYYKIFPQGDDRPHRYLTMPRIGLDIDEVLCDWVSGWQKKFGKHTHKKDKPEFWNFSYANSDRFRSMSKDEMEDFYLNLEPKIQPEDMPFEPHCYITSRGVSSELTKQWLQLHGFATVPVYSIGFNESKVEVAKQSGLEWFVDDNFSNFRELNNAGVCCYLMDAPHNRRYKVGHKRIYSLNDLL